MLSRFIFNGSLASRRALSLNNLAGHHRSLTSFKGAANPRDKQDFYPDRGLSFLGIPHGVQPVPIILPSVWVPQRQIQTTSILLEKTDDDKEAKPSLGKRFKTMLKDYWYVLIPVHVATSVVWFGGFYLLCKSGVDVGSILQTMGASEAYVEKISQSSMGYVALAYACYKIATPARYTVTLTGTTMSIKYLSDRGYLKTTHQVASDLRDRRDQVTSDLRDRREQLKGKSDEWVQAWQNFAERHKKHKGKQKDKE